jgi:paraquat-inducible protein A
MTVIAGDIPGLAACHNCDLLYEKTSVPQGKKSRCPRCGTILHVAIQDSLNKTLALSLTGLLLCIPAMAMPIMTFTVAGLKGTGSVIDGAMVLFQEGFPFVGVMVLLVSILFPLIKLGLLFWVSLSLKLKRSTANLHLIFRMYRNLSEWGMVEVYLLGILVSIIKMFTMASIDYHVGFFSFIALVLVTAGSSIVLDEDLFWRLIERGSEPPEHKSSGSTSDGLAKTAREAGLMRCRDCGKLVLQIQVEDDKIVRCPRCRAKLNSRTPGSIGRTWALVLTAIVLFLPANILPIMRVDYLGSAEGSTILDGIIYFFHSGDYLIGGIIFTASILVPLFKMVGILLILLSIRFHWRGWLKHKTGMFRFIEFIGRWSFLDIFVIALLSAMVRFGELTTIGADPAAPFFTAVVISTMFAALAFDPRLLWDHCDQSPENRRGQHHV